MTPTDPSFHPPMLRLLLLRHAKSSWADPGMADRDRPLAPRGQRAAALIGGELARRRLFPERILCSPARRTRETLAALLPHLASESRIAITAELYEPPTGDYLHAIARRGGDARSLMVIGHNPAIQATALDLAGNAEPDIRDLVAAKLPTGALAVIDFDAPAWDAVEPGTGHFGLFLKPGDLDPADDGD
jgi:phosphohistidine phosphatase